MIKPKAKKGFTLIELVIVIIIAAILLAMIMPKFSNLDRRATISLLAGFEAAINASIAQFSSHKMLQPEQMVDLGKGQIIEVTGYPIANADSIRKLITSEQIPNTFTKQSIAKTQACSNPELCILGGRRSSHVSISGFTTGRAVVLWPRGYKLNSCLVYYINPENGEKPQIGVISSGC